LLPGSLPTASNIVTVKELLGHADIKTLIKTTMRYAHSNDDAKRRSVQDLRKAANDNEPKTPANDNVPPSDKTVTVLPMKKKIAV
jgi:hypothetical protein